MKKRDKKKRLRRLRKKRIVVRKTRKVETSAEDVDQIEKR